MVYSRVYAMVSPIVPAWRYREIWGDMGSYARYRRDHEAPRPRLVRLRVRVRVRVRDGLGLGLGLGLP
jgi:hypothetical protein